VYFRSRDRDFDPAGTELPAVVQDVRRMGDSSCSHSLGGAGRSRSRRRERPSQGQSGPQCDSDAACPRARRDRHHQALQDEIDTARKFPLPSLAPTANPGPSRAGHCTPPQRWTRRRWVAAMTPLPVRCGEATAVNEMLVAGSNQVSLA
jgi:hypothetical protein